jgi:predicted dehydrogenase
MAQMNRRHFLEESMLAAAAAASASLAGAPRLMADDRRESSSPNERLRGAVIGVNGRGGDHISELEGRKGLEIAYICDIDTKVGNRRCIELGKKFTKPTYFQDIRKLLDEKSLDFVTIATPNHWHSLAAIWAMQAGKDVYVEKPISHNVSEGRRVVQTAAKYQRICQTGTQSRSSPGLVEAVAYLKAGQLGQVKLARGLCYKPRGSIGPRGNYPIPKEVDYNLWSGPAQIKPLTRPRFHYDWHWQWDYGNGDMGNQGIHQMDIARWGLGLNTLASSMLSYGGRFSYVDAGETPNTEVSVLEFGPEKTIVFEVRGLKTEDLKGAKVGVIFYGTEGYMVSPDYNGASVFDLNGKLIKSWRQGGDHFGNFLSAVRSRKASSLHAPILEGHLSSALCHLGNISYRLGEPHSNGEALEKLKSMKCNDDVQETLDRVVTHLSANKVQVGHDPQFRLGERLEFDPESETFKGSSAADAMLTRDYRAPFVVPSAEKI